MKYVEFVPKSDLAKYLKETINVEILNSLKNNIPIIYNQAVLDNNDKIISEENNRLNYLNEVYIKISTSLLKT